MNCCSTGVLNTEVDNWERGHHDFFVGRQLGQCEDFRYCNHSLAKPIFQIQTKLLGSNKQGLTKFSDWSRVTSLPSLYSMQEGTGAR